MQWHSPQILREYETHTRVKGKDVEFSSHAKPIQTPRRTKGDELLDERVLGSRVHQDQGREKKKDAIRRYKTPISCFRIQLA